MARSVATRSPSTTPGTVVRPQDLSTLSYDDLVVLGSQVSSASKWLLGDAAAQVAGRHKRHTIKDYAQAIGMHPGTLENYRTVAEAFPPKSRRRDIAFGSYQALAAQDDRVALLAGEPMTVADARQSGQGPGQRWWRFSR